MIENKIDSKEKIACCGDGYLASKSIIDSSFNMHDILDTDKNANIIKASALYHLAKPKYDNKDFDDVFTLQPLYMRASEAEILYEKLHSSNK